LCRFTECRPPTHRASRGPRGNSGPRPQALAFKHGRKQVPGGIRSGPGRSSRNRSPPPGSDGTRLHGRRPHALPGPPPGPHGVFKGRVFQRSSRDHLAARPAGRARASLLAWPAGRQKRVRPKKRGRPRRSAFALPAPLPPGAPRNCGPPTSPPRPPRFSGPAASAGPSPRGRGKLARGRGNSAIPTFEGVVPKRLRGDDGRLGRGSTWEVEGGAAVFRVLLRGPKRARGGAKTTLGPGWAWAPRFLPPLPGCPAPRRGVSAGGRPVHGRRGAWRGASRPGPGPVFAAGPTEDAGTGREKTSRLFRGRPVSDLLGPAGCAPGRPGRKT